MASTAIFIAPSSARLLSFHRDDLAALVVTAVRAHAVRELRLPALRADRARGRVELVVRAALAAAGLRVSSLRQRHEAPLWSSLVQSRGEILECGQARIGRPLGARAAREVPVGAARGAEPAAVLTAERLHRQRERRLTLDEPREIDLVVVVEVEVEVVGSELHAVSRRRAGDEAGV